MTCDNQRKHDVKQVYDMRGWGHSDEEMRAAARQYQITSLQGTNSSHASIASTVSRHVHVQWFKLIIITDRPELLGLPAGVLRHGHHLVDDGVHLLLVQEPVLVRVVHPEHDCNMTTHDVTDSGPQ